MSDTEAVTEKSVAPPQLFALIRDADQKKTRMQLISGELGERVKAAVENGHLNRSAFALVVKLHRQDELKRSDNIRAIRLYLDLCEENLWQAEAHVGDLAEAAERDAAADDAAAGEANAAALGKGIKPLRTEEEIAAEKADIAAQRERDARDFDAAERRPDKSRGHRRSALAEAEGAGTYSVQ